MEHIPEQRTIKLLLKIRERIEMLNKLTHDILVDIEPTVLTALMELFEQPKDSVAWIEIGHTEENLVLVCIITYNPSNMSTFLRYLLNEQTNLQNVEKTQFLHIGIPIVHIYSNKDVIKNYLIEASNIPIVDDNMLEQKPVKEINSKVNINFDLSLLTEDQKQRISLTYKKGVKH